MEFWQEMTFCMSVSLFFFFFLARFPCSEILKKQLHMFEQTNSKPSFLHDKTRFFHINSIIDATYLFVPVVILYDNGKVECHRLNYHGNSIIVRGKIMEFYFLLSVEPC